MPPLAVIGGACGHNSTVATCRVHLYVLDLAWGDTSLKWKRKGRGLEVRQGLEGRVSDSICVCVFMWVYVIE